MTTLIDFLQEMEQSRQAVVLPARLNEDAVRAALAFAADALRADVVYPLETTHR
jgi:hypothetical protein